MTLSLLEPSSILPCVFEPMDYDDRHLHIFPIPQTEGRQYTIEEPGILCPEGHRERSLKRLAPRCTACLVASSRPNGSFEPWKSTACTVLLTTPSPATDTRCARQLQNYFLYFRSHKYLYCVLQPLDFIARYCTSTALCSVPDVGARLSLALVCGSGTFGARS